MKLKLNDKVLVIAGKDKGKSGKIIKVDHKHNKIVVEKINLRTKHVKKTDQHAGQTIKFEGSIDASNVMILDPSNNKPTRIGYKALDNGKKERVSKLTGTALDNVVADNETADSEEKKEAKAKKASATKGKKKTIKA